MNAIVMRVLTLSSAGSYRAVAEHAARGASKAGSAAISDEQGYLDRLLGQAERFETSLGTGRMVWHAWGAGPPLVLFHGGAGSWRHWVRNIGFFAARGRRVVCADLPGLGESDMPPEPDSPPAMAALIADGLRAVIGEARYDLAGFSFGGSMAGVVAAREGARLRSLTIVGSRGLGLPRGRTPLVKVRKLEGAARMEGHRTNLGRLMIADPAKIDALALAIQDWNSDRSRMNSPAISGGTWLRDSLRDVRGPVFGIWGTLDAPSMPDIWASERAMRSLRPDLRFVAIEGAGHWVAYEAADAFNAALARLLGG